MIAKIKGKIEYIKGRFVVVDAAKDPDQVREAIAERLTALVR